MSGWICQWKPVWIPVGKTSQKAYLEEWLRVGDDSTSDFGEHSTKAILTVNVSTTVRKSQNKDCTVKHKQPLDAPSEPRSSWQPVEQLDAPTWELLGPQGTASFWERTEAPLPLPKRRCNFSHPKQLSPFLLRLELPYPSGEILSDHEDVVSSSQDCYTTWVKTDPDATLVRHVVDVQKAVAEFCEASERRHIASSQVYRLDKNVPNRSPVQKRLSIYSWNPGPRRGKEDAFEKQIAGKWHVITLQEASEYVDHDILTNRFHVTHYGGCAILYMTRRDLPDQVMEGDQEWVMQGVLSRASFRRPPLSGQKTFTVMSLHVSNIYAQNGVVRKSSSSQSEPS